MRTSVVRLQLTKQLIPAYVFHPRIETVESDVQGYHWTGCRLVEGAPRAIREREATVDMSLFKKEIEKNIIVSREFEAPSKENGCPPSSYPTSLVHHILMSVFSRAPSYPQLRNLHLAQGLRVSGSWDCHGHQVAVSGRPGDMLLSKNPLPPIFSAEEVNSARPVATPTRELFSDLEQWKIHNWAEQEAEEKERVGRLPDTFPHLHTLLIVNTARHYEVQHLQKGLLFMFSRLVQQAVRQYGSSVVSQGTVLPTPLCGQCLVTDGRRVSVMWLQIENLQVSAEDGERGRNVVAVERLGLLYEDTDMLRGRKKRRVVNFDVNVLRTLLATLLMH